MTETFNVYQELNMNWFFTVPCRLNSTGDGRSIHLPEGIEYPRVPESSLAARIMREGSEVGR